MQCIVTIMMQMHGVHCHFSLPDSIISCLPNSTTHLSILLQDVVPIEEAACLPDDDKLKKTEVMTSLNHMRTYVNNHANCRPHIPGHRYYILSSFNMPLSERLLGSSNKRPRRSSLYLWRAVILSVCLASAFSYTQARGRPDRSGLRVQRNVTGKTDRERERQSVRVSCLLPVMCHSWCRRPWGAWPYISQASYSNA